MADIQPTVRFEYAGKTYTMHDQAAFAELTGDFNPMHMDPVAARRAPAGRPVVHGLHLVLYGLELLLARRQDLRPAKLRVRFAKPVLIEEPVKYFVTGPNAGAIVVEVAVNGRVCATVEIDGRLSLGPRPAIRPSESSFRSGDPHVACERTFTQFDGLDGGFAPRFGDRYGALFPCLDDGIGRASLAGLGGLSRLVGMECPGLYSVFGGFDAELGVQGGDRIAFAVTAADERFRIVTMRATGSGIDARVEAFARVPPVGQPPTSELARLVSPGAFSRDKVLVVGGSRGLGEVAAKLLAAGGADVTLTYAVGAAEADAVADDIRRAGGICRIARFDATRDDADALVRCVPDLTHLHYYATCKIAGGKTSAAFDPLALQQYLDIYVAGLSRLCAALAFRADHPVGVLYPSSAAIDGGPNDFLEYAMAKAAGEVLCTYLARSSGLRFVTPRFPRVLTDQTATIVPVETAAIGSMMLNALHSLHGGN